MIIFFLNMMIAVSYIFIFEIINKEYYYSNSYFFWSEKKNFFLILYLIAFQNIDKRHEIKLTSNYKLWKSIL